MTIMDQIELPYTYPEKGEAPTSGHSGTDTSKAQARSPRRANVQRTVLAYVTNRMTRGATIAELRKYNPSMHHGSLSSALTNLHRAGKLERLEEQRDRCHVYVAPLYANGRSTQPAALRKPGTESVGTGSQPAAEPTAAALLAAEGYGYQRGLLEGRKAGEQAAFDETSEFITRLIAASKPTLAVTHHSGCYAKHPVCAMRAIQNFVSKGGAMV